MLYKGAYFEFPKLFSSWCIENILFKVNCAEGHVLTAIEAAQQVSKDLARRSKTVDNIKEVLNCADTVCVHAPGTLSTFKAKALVTIEELWPLLSLIFFM